MKLTTLLYQPLRLRVCTAVPLLIHLIAWCKTFDLITSCIEFGPMLSLTEVRILKIEESKHGREVLMICK